MSRTRMYIAMITKSFVRRLSRVIIASLSIIVGATTLSALAIITYTVPEQIALQLRTYGANVVVSPSGSNIIDTTQVERINSALSDDGVTIVGYAPYRYENLVYNQQGISVVGTDLSLANSMRPYWSIDGALPKTSGEVLVGRDLATRYGFTTGQQIQVRTQTAEGTDAPAVPVTITGVLRTGGAEDSQLIMSLDDLDSIVPAKHKLDVVEYSILGDEDTVASAATSIDGASPAAHAQVVKRIAKSESSVLLTLRSLIWIVSAVVGALTLISVSTTMNAVVSERATELALKKALGASSKQILTEFFGESVILGLFGGLVGAMGGMAVAGAVTQEVFNFGLQTNWWVIPITMVTAALVSGLGSLVTTRRITSIDPATVLGGE